MAENVHWKQYTADFLGAYSIKEGEELILTIKDVVRQKVKNESNKEDVCTVLQFKEAGAKPMVLNATNAKTIEKIYSTGIVSDWVGKKIQIYVLPNQKAFGEIHDVLRIRPKSPDLPFLTPEHPRWAGALAKVKDGTTSLAAIKNSFQLKPEHEKLLTNA